MALESMVTIRDTTIYFPPGLELDRREQAAYASLPANQRVTSLETRLGAITNVFGGPERRRWTRVRTDTSEGWIAAKDLALAPRSSKILSATPASRRVLGSVRPSVPYVPPTGDVTTTPPSTLPVLFQGVRGEESNVRFLQTLLAHEFPWISIDGDFGTQTADVVRRYQSAHGLPATAVVDAATWDVLQGGARTAGTASTGAERFVTGSRVACFPGRQTPCRVAPSPELFLKQAFVTDLPPSTTFRVLETRPEGWARVRADGPSRATGWIPSAYLTPVRVERILSASAPPSPKVLHRVHVAGPATGLFIGPDLPPTAPPAQQVPPPAPPGAPPASSDWYHAYQLYADSVVQNRPVSTQDLLYARYVSALQAAGLPTPPASVKPTHTSSRRVRKALRRALSLGGVSPATGLLLNPNIPAASSAASRPIGSFGVPIPYVPPPLGIGVLANLRRDAAFYPGFALDRGRSQGDVRRAARVILRGSQVRVLAGPYAVPNDKQAPLVTVSVHPQIMRLRPGDQVYLVRTSAILIDPRTDPMRRQAVRDAVGFVDAAALQPIRTAPEVPVR